MFASAPFSLANTSDYADYALVFDQYRIAGIEVRFSPSDVLSVVGGNVYSVIDYDDSNNLTSVAAALSYSNCIVSSCSGESSVVLRSFKPHVAAAVYGSGAFTSYQNTTDAWIDSNSPNVNYFGMKWGVTVTGSTVIFNMDVRLHIQWRNNR